MHPTHFSTSRSSSEGTLQSMGSIGVWLLVVVRSRSFVLVSIKAAFFSFFRFMYTLWFLAFRFLWYLVLAAPVFACISLELRYHSLCGRPGRAVIFYTCPPTVRLFPAVCLSLFGGLVVHFVKQTQRRGSRAEVTRPLLCRLGGQVVAYIHFPLLCLPICACCFHSGPSFLTCEV